MSKKVLLIDQFKKLLQMTFSSSVRWGGGGKRMA